MASAGTALPTRSHRPASTIASPENLSRELPLPWNRLEQDVVHWASRAYLQAKERASATPQLRLQQRIIQYLSGSQWPARPTAYGNSRPVTNRMFRQYWEMVSLLTDGKPEPQVKVWDTDDSGFSEIQRLLCTLLEPWAGTPRYHQALQSIIGFGLLTGGVGKVQWNPYLSGGLGDVELLSINPAQFFRLGGDGPLENCECLIEERLVTLASLHRRYGEIARLVKPDAESDESNLRPMRPSSITSEQWGKYNAQMQGILSATSGARGITGVSDSIYPMVTERLLWFRDPSYNETSSTLRVGPLRANWSYLVEPGCPLFPRGRVLSIAGGRVLDDTCNPYFHQHGPCAPGPYVEFLPLRTPWLAGSMSVTGNLIGPQDILNRLMAGMLETIKAGLVPTVMSPSGSLSRADRDNWSSSASGGNIEYDVMRTMGQKPEFRKQPDFPSAAMPYTQMIMREMDQTTGSTAVDAAAQKQQIPSHDTMEMIQNSRSYMVRLMGRQLEQFMNESGQMVISNMLQFYSMGRRTALLGNKGVVTWDFTPNYGSLVQNGYLPESFVRKFQFSVRTGSALSFDKDTRAQLAVVLGKGGLISQKMVIRALNAAGAGIDEALNEKELAQEALQKMAMGAIAGMAGGAKRRGGK